MSPADFPPSPALTLAALDAPTRVDDLDGDNWPLTWARDDALYAAYGDGWGRRALDPATKRNTGLVRLRGTSDDPQAEEVPCPWFGRGAEDPNLKGCGLLAAGGTLYHFLRYQVPAAVSGPATAPAPARRQVASRLIWSPDRGQTWHGATDYGPDPDHLTWHFREPDHAFHSPTFLQAGRDYAAAPDDYAYIYSPREDRRLGNDALDLARVRGDQIADRAAYRFFAGLDRDGRPLWDERCARREPVLRCADQVSCGDLVYLPQVRRYLLATCGGGGLLLLDAPAPWGPWTRVGHVARWGGGEDGDTRYDPRLPAKWLADDGGEGVLVYSDRRRPSDKMNAQRIRLGSRRPRPARRQRGLDAFAEALMQRDTHCLLVTEGEQTRLARYAPGWGPERRHGTASLAKTLAGAMGLLAAIDLGALALDDPATRYVAAWRGDPLRQAITVRQLATHTSGLDDAEEGGLPHDQLTGWKGRFWRRDPDPFRIARDEADLVGPPATRFLYSNPGNAMLGYCLGAALGGTATPDLRALLREAVLGPLGVSDAAWAIGYDGPTRMDGLTLYATWGGAAFTAPATAAAGRLLLHGGAAMRRLRTEVGTPLAPRVQPVNGLGLWLNVDGAWPELPPDTVAGAGAGHQLLVAIPSRGIVVVRYGGRLAPGADFWGPLHRHLLAPLGEALG